MPKVTLAIDIGATKIAIAAIDQNIKILRRSSFLIAGAEDLNFEFAQAIQEFVNDEHWLVCAIGIASAGPINRATGVISPVNIPQWHEFNVVEFVQELTPAVPISFIQDAVAVAIAEKEIGAGRKFENMLGMVVSTGVGGGLILNGKIFHGELGNAGFFGHHTIEITGSRCRCGRNGCVENFASGPSMVNYAQANGWTGQPDFESLAISARAHNLYALAAIDRGAQALAIGILNTLAILDISSVVIGGGVSLAGSIYWDPLLTKIRAEYRHMTLSQQPHIVPAQLGADAGLLGAALSAHSK